jgi:hypothetical protein
MESHPCAKPRGEGVPRVSAHAPVDPMFPSQWRPCKPSGIKGLLHSAHHTTGRGARLRTEPANVRTFQRATRSARTLAPATVLFSYIYFTTRCTRKSSRTHPPGPASAGARQTRRALQRRRQEREDGRDDEGRGRRGDKHEGSAEAVRRSRSLHLDRTPAAKAVLESKQRRRERCLIVRFARQSIVWVLGDAVIA